MDNLLNILFTPKCLFCSATGAFFCTACISKCPLLTSQFCLCCGKKSALGITHKECLTSFTPTQLLCIYEYTGLVRDCILKSKYGAKQFLALKNLACSGARQLVVTQLYSASNLKEFTIVSVPVSKEKERSRGFNHVDAIVDEISRVTKQKKEKSSLSRIKETSAQHSYNRHDRFANVKASFYAHPDFVEVKSILLVDDICTSGATFIEASKALYASGAKEVKCLALSKRL